MLAAEVSGFHRLVGCRLGPGHLAVYVSGATVAATGSGSRSAADCRAVEIIPVHLFVDYVSVEPPVPSVVGPKRWLARVL